MFVISSLPTSDMFYVRCFYEEKTLQNVCTHGHLYRKNVIMMAMKNMQILKLIIEIELFKSAENVDINYFTFVLF